MSLDYATVSRFPLLEKDEETALWAEYFNPTVNNSKKERIKGRIIESHLRLAMSMARAQAKRGYDFDELFSAGQVGLVQAFKRFDPDRGLRFSTLARWWVKSEIQDFIFDSTSIINGEKTHFQKYLFFHYARLRKIFSYANPDKNDDDIDHMIADYCVQKGHCTKKRGGDAFTEIELYKKTHMRVLSLDQAVSDDSEGANFVDTIEDLNIVPIEERIGKQQEQYLRSIFLNAARAAFISEGKVRSWDILSSRHLKDSPETLESIAGRYGISKERVRQIEADSIDKLRAMAAPKIKKEIVTATKDETAPSDNLSLKRKYTRRIKTQTTPDQENISLPDVLKVDFYMLAEARNTDPSIPLTPYVGSRKSYRQAVTLLEAFVSGNHAGFERASKVENGHELKGQGRWVYVGLPMGAKDGP